MTNRVRAFGKSKGLRLPEFLRSQISKVAAAESLTETEAIRLLIMSGLANREAAIQGRGLKRLEDLAERLERLVNYVAPQEPPLPPTAVRDYKQYYDEREFDLPPSHQGRPS